MSDSLQFERAEFAAETPARAVCTTCDQDVVQSYYELAGSIICPTCRESRQNALAGLGLGRFFRASAAGVVAGIAGAALWYGVRVVTNYEVGIIAIAVGFAVGKAVSWGSSGKGGWLYQSLAILLTYCAVALNYVPDVAKGLMAEGAGIPAVILYVASFILALALPFLGGIENAIGILIIAIGLFEAWKLNKRIDADMTGPYSVAPSAPPAPAALPAPVPNV